MAEKQKQKQKTVLSASHLSGQIWISLAFLSHVFENGKLWFSHLP